MRLENVLVLALLVGLGYLIWQEFAGETPSWVNPPPRDGTYGPE